VKCVQCGNCCINRPCGMSDAIKQTLPGGLVASVCLSLRMFKTKAICLKYNRIVGTIGDHPCTNGSYLEEIKDDLFKRLCKEGKVPPLTPEEADVLRSSKGYPTPMGGFHKVDNTNYKVIWDA
jgi:hypothetical protein